MMVGGLRLQQGRYMASEGKLKTPNFLKVFPNFNNVEIFIIV